MVPSAPRILGQSMSIVLRHLPAFLVLALLLFLPVLVVAWIVGGAGAVVPAHPAATEVVAQETSPLGAQFVVGILAFVAQFLLAGAVAPGVLAELEGKPARPMAALRHGLERLVPVGDVAFVVGVVVGIGFFLFVVPGLVLGALLFVAVPVAVVERPSLFAALRRSRDLTAGHRVTLALVLAATVGLLFASGLLLPLLLAPLGRLVALVAATAAQAFFGVYAGVCQSVAYAALREDSPVS